MPVKILSVDDSRTVRCIVGAALLPYDCILCEAANGAEGLALARREKPDLIVLDVSMPVMDKVYIHSTRRRTRKIAGYANQGVNWTPPTTLELPAAGETTT